MPSPVPTPNFNHIPTSIPFVNQGTEIYLSNNNYANDDPLFHYFNDENELNDDDQAYIISTSECHKNDYYVAHNSNPANSSDSLHPISHDERKMLIIIVLSFLMKSSNSYSIPLLIVLLYTNPYS